MVLMKKKGVEKIISLVLVSHGSFSKGLAESAELIMGEQENVTTIGFHLGDDFDVLKQQIYDAVSDGLSKGEVLVLTDLKAGSPFNATVAVMCKLKFKHITGINLPTYLEILGDREFMELDEIMESIIEQGRETLENISDIITEVIDEEHCLGAY